MVPRGSRVRSKAVSAICARCTARGSAAQRRRRAVHRRRSLAREVRARTPARSCRDLQILAARRVARSSTGPSPSTRDNVEQLEGWGIPRDRIERVGNLAIDGALFEAAQAREEGTPEDGILIMPGSRTYEVENLIPFFFAVALRVLRDRRACRSRLQYRPSRRARTSKRRSRAAAIRGCSGAAAGSSWKTSGSI